MLVLIMQLSVLANRNADLPASIAACDVFTSTSQSFTSKFCFQFLAFSLINLKTSFTDVFNEFKTIHNDKFLYQNVFTQETI